MAPTSDQQQAAIAEATCDGMKKQRKPRFKKTEHEFPVEPRIIQVVKKPKTFVDHSYRDFSQVPADMKYEGATTIDQMSFSEKVYDMLQDESYANWIQWLPHGRGFRIPVPKRLEQSQVLLKYFGHNRYSSFLRQLNNHGFKHVTRGIDRNSYYHECFLRGMKHLLKYMPPGRDARRLMPDPDNEPDFYAISRVCPLPHERAQQAAPQVSVQETPVQQPLDIQSLINHSAAPLSLGLPAMQSLRAAQPQAPLHQASSFQQQAVNLQQVAALRKQTDASLYSSLFKATGGGLSHGGLPSMVNQSLPRQAQQLDDPAVLALLLRSRAANSFFGFQV